jgi:hypothetical protein
MLPHTERLRAMGYGELPKDKAVVCEEGCS